MRKDQLRQVIAQFNADYDTDYNESTQLHSIFVIAPKGFVWSATGEDTMADSFRIRETGDASRAYTGLKDKMLEGLTKK